MDQNRYLFLLFCSVYCLGIFGCHTKQGSFYRMERGDSIWGVAHVHELEVEEILRANPQLNVKQIRVGERIFLPGVGEIKDVPKKPKLDVEQWVPTKKTTSSKKTPPKRVVQKTRTTSTTRFQWPYKGRVISSFGMRGQKMHNGIDIQLPADAMIRASLPGKVVYVGDQIEGYDRIVILLHDDLIFTIYAFVGEFTVQKNQEVKAGDAIAKARNTPPTSFFHFEIRRIKTSLNPEKLLN